MKSAKKCPVCNWEIKDGGRRAKIGQRVVVVCCDDCATKVRKEAKSSGGNRSVRGAR